MWPGCYPGGAGSGRTLSVRTPLAARSILASRRPRRRRCSMPPTHADAAADHFAEGQRRASRFCVTGISGSLRSATKPVDLRRKLTTIPVDSGTKNGRLCIPDRLCVTKAWPLSEETRYAQQHSRSVGWSIQQCQRNECQSGNACHQTT
jgi:hypothetical protein